MTPFEVSMTWLALVMAALGGWYALLLINRNLQ